MRESSRITPMPLRIQMRLILIRFMFFVESRYYPMLLTLNELSESEFNA